MEHLYVILNKSYHDALIRVACNGDNPLKFIEDVVIYCPEDPSQTRVAKRADVYSGVSKHNLLTDFAGRTTILY